MGQVVEQAPREEIIDFTRSTMGGMPEDCCDADNVVAYNNASGNCTACPSK